VRAAGILIVEGASQFGTRGRSDGDFASSSVSGSFAAPISLQNLVLQDLLGESVLNRMINRLERYGIQPISVLSEGDDSCDLWSSLENQLVECAERDIKAAVVIWLGAYTEIDFFELLRFHRENREPVTWVHDSQGPLPIGVFDLKQRMAWADWLHDGWNAYDSTGGPYLFDGYVNRLETAYDFRRLTQDALLRRCELRPVGTESRPGLWLGEGARVPSGRQEETSGRRSAQAWCLRLCTPHPCRRRQVSLRSDNVRRRSQSRQLALSTANTRTAGWASQRLGPDLLTHFPSQIAVESPGRVQRSAKSDSAIATAFSTGRQPGPAKATNPICSGQAGAELYPQGRTQQDGQPGIHARQARAPDLLSRLLVTLLHRPTARVRAAHKRV
jgi:hypothetical protein